jgi:uncharacterized membrane protein
MLDLFLVISFCVLGVITGIATGLLPGLHVNNIALILLSLSGAIVGAFSFLFDYGVSEQFILLLISQMKTLRFLFYLHTVFYLKEKVMKLLLYRLWVAMGQSSFVFYFFIQFDF